MKADNRRKSSLANCAHWSGGKCFGENLSFGITECSLWGHFWWTPKSNNKIINYQEKLKRYGISCKLGSTRKLLVPAELAEWTCCVSIGEWEDKDLLSTIFLVISKIPELFHLWDWFFFFFFVEIFAPLSGLCFKKKKETFIWKAHPWFTVHVTHANLHPKIGSRIKNFCSLQGKTSLSWAETWKWNRKFLSCKAAKRFG